MEFLNASDSLMKHSELAKMIIDRSYQEAKPGEFFVLASGKRSRFYFECKKTTWSAAASPLIARAFIEKIHELPAVPNAVGGLKSGADPIAYSISIHSTYAGLGPEIRAFSIRKERKGHGAGQIIEGCVDPGETVVIVDDVVTSGLSVVQAINTCRDEGLEIAAAMILVDREDEQKGMDRIREEVPGVPVTAIFKWSELSQMIESQYGHAPHA